MNIFINNDEQRLRAGWRILIQFIVMFLLVGFGIMGVQQVWSDPLMIYTMLPQFIGIILSVWLAAKLLDNRPFTDYGIKFNSRWIKDFGAGCLIAALAQGTIFVIQWWAGWVTIIDYGWNAGTNLPFFLGFSSFFFSMLMVGFHEELLYRGYQILNLTEGLQYPSIGTNGALTISILLTSSVFGFMHFFNPNASFISTFNIILAGIILAVPFVITGSLGLSTGLHFSWNFVMAGVFGFPVSGMGIDFSVLKIQQSGSDFLTGGTFGPEAGLLGLLGMAIMLGVSLVYIIRTDYKLDVAPLFKNDEQSGLKQDEQSP